MKFRLLSAIVVAVSLAAAASAQDAGSPPPAGQDSGNPGPGNGGNGQRGGRGGRGQGMMGPRVTGTVTDVAADHFTVKTETGDVYTVHFTSDTRMMKMGAGRGAGGGGNGAGGGQRQGQGGGGMRGGGGGNAPQQIKPSDIKVGDVITAMGDTDTASKSVSARIVAQMDPERVKQIREMEANFGKTWLAGKVTAINDANITLTGTQDNTPHTVVADENTTLRKGRDPITLADLHVGDMIRVDGSVKDGVFTATTVTTGGMMGGGQPGGPPNNAPGNGPPPQ